ncbi:hypothetical protein FQZ97_866710 [compost metagenome]
MLTSTSEVSTVKFSESLATLLFPALSVRVALMLCAPLSSGVDGVNAQLPPASTVAVPSTLEPSLTVTVAPASAPLPLKVGVASSVAAPAAMLPVTLPMSSTALTMPGLAGAWVSSTTL